jgi:acetate kinase
LNEGYLVINAGSSSIKFALFARGDGEPALRLKGKLEGLGADPAFSVRDAAGRLIHEHDEWGPGSTLSHAESMQLILDWLDGNGGDLRITAAGHRVVHGGGEFVAPVPIDAGVLARLQTLEPLAPLHQPHNLAAIRALADIAPQLPQVACFDTAFHATQPALARTFALPRALTDSGIRRYGFHGLSYEYIARRLPALTDARRVVVAHLGNGASLCAMQDGRSVEGTMGFTALDGLVMGTRTGALDPGVLLYLLQSRGYDADALEKLLYTQSGLLGVSGISSDMRELEGSADPRAREAIELFVYRISACIGQLAAALGGIDALVFTAGIGENSALVRERACRGAAWLGLALDEAANRAGETRISTASSAVSAWVVPTDEELMIALHTDALMRKPG